MDPRDLERLAPTNAPEPWLAIVSPGRDDSVVGVASTEDELDIWKIKKRMINWIKLGHDIVPMKDSPSLHVHYSSGLWFQATPAHLAARKNWFLRYRDILETQLSNPLPALVHFYERRPLEDLLGTMRSTKLGPFPFPINASWPLCGHCRERMSFIGVLDFRNYHRIGNAGISKGSLVLHGCEECITLFYDNESMSLKWIMNAEHLELRGEKSSDKNAIEVGVAWETIEFPPPAFDPKDLCNDPGFMKEWGIDNNFFTCPLNKVGGCLHWIQGDCTPEDEKGNQMQYIGQFIGSHDIELGDAGILYVFFSDETQETTAVLQYY